jgi:hypothetical protein
MVPGEGFEPPTFGLQNRCTTTVLTRPAVAIIVWKSLRIKVLPRLHDARRRFHS